MTTWFITGCSTGLGRELALAVLERGDDAVVTARDTSTVADLVERFPDRALALRLDVSDADADRRAVAEAEARFGGVDVLVNNAGYGYRAALEEGEADEVAALFATNLFGPIALIQAVLPGMRDRRRGAIVNVSSIAARSAAPGSGYYAATKVALIALTDALRKEVGPLGIRAFAVEPGALRTDFSGRSLRQSADAIADYAPTAGTRRKENETGVDGHQPGDPARAAAAIVDAVDAPDAPFRLVLGSDAVGRAEQGLAEARAELDAWLTVSRGIDFPAG